MSEAWFFARKGRREAKKTWKRLPERNSCVLLQSNLLRQFAEMAQLVEQFIRNE